MTDLKDALEGIGYIHEKRPNGKDFVNPTVHYKTTGDSISLALGEAFRHAYVNREVLMNAIIKSFGGEAIMQVDSLNEALSEALCADEPCNAVWDAWVQYHGLEAHTEAN